MPTLTIFAGINGAGKSSLYKTYITKHPNADFGKHINMDEILCAFNGVKNSFDDNIKAGKIVVKNIDECIKNKISFNWETTIFSLNSLKILQKAKDNGFEINIHFIATPNANLAIQRVYNRSNNGGHFVPEAFIIGRHVHQFDNFKVLTNLSNSIYFYENNDKIKLMGIYHNKKFAYINKKCSWMKNIISNLSIEK